MKQLLRKTLMVISTLVFVGSTATFANDRVTANTDPRIYTVLEMIDAWNTQNWQKVVDLFADDGVLHSMMVEPIVGREAISERIFHLGSGIESITLQIRNIGVIGDVVVIERRDEFVFNGHEGAVPVVGILEVKNGKVQEWREYYDRAELIAEMGLNKDFDKDAR